MEKWFYWNRMARKPGKCHCMSNVNHNQLAKKILYNAEIVCKDNEKIQASLSIKSLGFDVYMKPL